VFHNRISIYTNMRGKGSTIGINTVIVFMMYISGAMPLGILSGLINGNQKLEWKQFGGNGFAVDAIRLYPYSSQVHYFCRVSKDGNINYGYIRGDQLICKYSDTSNIVQTATNFDILHGDNSRARLKYVGVRQSAEDLKNKKVVSCNLDDKNASDCYFGAGVYSDGICEEDPGIIVPSKNRIYMPDDQGKKPSVCGVYTALVYV